jgi:hypothetical protein
MPSQAEIAIRWKGTARRDKEIKREFFYAFLRNRLTCRGIRFSIVMAK